MAVNEKIIPKINLKNGTQGFVSANFNSKLKILYSYYNV
jgi:hypothetical protein